MDLGQEDQLARFQRIRKEPLEFLRYARTLDEVDRKNPIKPFPVDTDYLRLYVHIWLKKRLIAVPKSRRMIMSWTNIGLSTWDTAYHLGCKWAFVSKKEEDSDELIKRSKFILENLDNSGIPKEWIPRWEYSFCRLRFPELNSMIMGFPSGADQLRQFTFSGILADEMAFWDNAEEMFSGSFPTLEGKDGREGGRFVAISSAGPGFFQRLVFDQFDQDVEQVEE